MRNNEPSAPGTETRHSSCPYPVTPGEFPMPSSSENPASDNWNIDGIPIGMMSPYFRDHITVPAGTGNIQRLSNPSVPNMNGNGEPTHIGFSNPLADQSEVTSSEPPPSYDQLFAPKNVVPPKTIPNGTSTYATTTTPPRVIIVPRTATAPRNRIITHPPAQLVGVRSNSSDGGTGTCIAAIVLTFIAVLIIFVVHSSLRL